MIILSFTVSVKPRQPNSVEITPQAIVYEDLRYA